MFTQLIITSAAVALMTTPLLAMAATSTDPVSQFGILGTYNNFTLKGAGRPRKTRCPRPACSITSATR
ncbi:hypothetical protein QNM99_23610 [Pseudomonas sp. PCH446]